MDRLDGFVRSGCLGAIFGFLAGGRDGVGRVLCLVIHDAVPLRNNKAAVSAVTNVTVLGATGSIGDSTMDLLAGRARPLSVKRLTANTNVQGLAKLAREIWRAICGGRRSRSPFELKMPWPAHAPNRRGRSAIIEAAARPAIGSWRRQWCRRIEAGARGCGPRRVGCACQQGMLVCAGDFFMQRAAKAGCIWRLIPSTTRLFQALGRAIEQSWLCHHHRLRGPFRTWASADIEQPHWRRR